MRCKACNGPLETLRDNPKSGNLEDLCSTCRKLVFPEPDPVWAREDREDLNILLFGNSTGKKSRQDE